MLGNLSEISRFSIFHRHVVFPRSLRTFQCEIGQRAEILSRRVYQTFRKSCVCLDVMLMNECNHNRHDEEDTPTKRYTKKRKQSSGDLENEGDESQKKGNNTM